MMVEGGSGSGAVSFDFWEALVRAPNPQQGLSELIQRVAREIGAGEVRIGVVDLDSPTVRWLAAGGPKVRRAADLVYLSAGEAERLDAYLRAEPLTRGDADSLPRPLQPLLGGADGEVVIAALPRAGATPGLLVARPVGPGEVAGRAIATLAPALALALERASLPLEPAPRQPPTATLASTDRDGLSDKIIGADLGLRTVMQRVRQVSRSDVPVLILGETGSGKEVIARALHTQSPRAGAAFIRVNCGAIPPELIDSELFGHEKGSFTGASDRRRGWFEQADGGTLFLDEIGELPLAAQVRLLRILQEGTFQRVGGERTIKVDVRVIAATHRNLSEMIQAGRFREDLWYRLDVFPIRLPPLREHPEDIPAMAEHFARQAAARFGLSARSPTAADLARLMSYAWPGNVRELGAVIDRAVLLGEGERLEVAKALGEPADRPTSGGEPDARRGERLATLDEAIRRHIEEALRRCHGRIEGPRGAARMLDVNPHTLRGKMRKLGVIWNEFR